MPKKISFATFKINYSLKLSYLFMEQEKKHEIREIVRSQLKDFSDSIVKDYSLDGSKGNNIQKKKANNFLINNLGNDIVVYSTLMRSLDSSLGNRIERIALEVASASGYKVSQGVEGFLSRETTKVIATLLESYKDKKNKKKPTSDDLKKIQEAVINSGGKSKFLNSDYLLEKKENGVTYLSLLELKAGGDLDNKKAQSEKRSILEQYALLVSKYKDKLEDGTAHIELFFATAYNKDSLNDGSDNWSQGSVSKFFAPTELLIGRDFWNFICDDKEGWDLIKSSYKENSYLIANSLKSVIESFN